MSQVVMKILGLVNGQPSVYDDQYIVIVDVDELILETSPDLAQAKRWPHAAATLDVWRHIKADEPVRPDGQANRPLTAFSVEVVDAEQAEP